MTNLTVFSMNKQSFIKLFALSNAVQFVYKDYRFHSISLILLFHYFLFSQRYQSSISETMSSHELTESSKAVRLLWKKLLNGEISLTDNAKAVRESEPLFKKRKWNNFWTKFNRLKTEHKENEGKYKVCNLSFFIWTIK